MNVGYIRFPGGEVSDNYNWITNGLDDPSEFPGESTNPAERDEQRKARMKTAEFLQMISATRAQGAIVVNLEGAFLHLDRINGKPQEQLIEEYIQRAEEWVRFTNIVYPRKMRKRYMEKLLKDPYYVKLKASNPIEFNRILGKKADSYRVKYWEIGNESYLKVTRYPLASTHYAYLLNRFSRAMKRVDPHINIGAIGPTGLQRGYMNNYTEKGRREFRKILIPNRLRNHDDYLGGQLKNKGVFEIYHFFNEMIEPRYFKWNMPEEFRTKAKGWTAFVQSGYLEDVALAEETVDEPLVWWQDIFNNSRGNFDYVVLHDYNDNRYGCGNANPTYVPDFSKRQDISKPIKKIRNLYSSAQDIPVAVTEWNTCNAGDRPFIYDGGRGTFDHSLAISEQLMNYVNGGVFMANFHPLNGAASNLPLFVSAPAEAGLENTDAYRALSFVNQNILDRVHLVTQKISSVKSDIDLEILVTSSKNGRDLRIVVINKNDQSRLGSFDINAQVESVTDVRAYVRGNEKGKIVSRSAKVVSLAENSSKVQTSLPAKSIVVINLKLAEGDN